MQLRTIAALLLVTTATLAAPQHHKLLAPTPPMGWNSWDAYGWSITEQQFRDNVQVLVQLRDVSADKGRPSWQYAVIDEGWYFRHPRAATAAGRSPLLDAYGRLVPVPERFPSAGQDDSLAALAAWVHSQGLKFGIHLLRGIPRDAVARNLPIAGSTFHAQDAADPTDACPWDETNWGVKDNAAGQAWYDSQVKLYGGWGVDFLKVDCISDHTYKPLEIRMIADAIRKSGYPIVLSLSPGPTRLHVQPVVSKYSQMWRIADDHWDMWGDNSGKFPNGVYQAFDMLAAWEKYAKPGNWPDADMMPIGDLEPYPGYGEPRQTRLTHDEVKTEFTLWCMARSPLILGNNLTRLDGFTRGVITNKELIAIDQSGMKNHEQLREGALRAWTAERGGGRHYVAVFNTGDTPMQVDLPWSRLGVAWPSAAMTSLWDGSKTPAADALRVTLAPHASAVYQVVR
jgi:hypothetical protein